MIPWRQQYAEPGRDAELGDATAIWCDSREDRAVQSYKDDSDINVLVRRFGVTGELPRAAVQPFYGDFSEVVDYQTALNMIRDAHNAFDSLPSRVRNRFQNDPSEIIRFLQDPANRQEAEVLGLVPKAPPVEPVILKDEPAGDPPAL